MTRTLILINESSGGVATAGPDACVDALHEVFSDEGTDIDIHFASGDPGGLLEAAKASVERCGGADCDPERIILLAGDGTASAVAGVLADSNTLFAPLPGGTMNALARDLGYDPHILEAVKQLSSVEETAVDVAFVNDRAFLNNIVFGAYAVVADSREQLREAGTIGEKALAVGEILGAISHADTENYKLSVDGRIEAVDTNTVMIANNIYVGAEAMRPLRDRLDAGKLGLYVAHSRTPAEFIGVLYDALAGNLDESDTIDVSECKKCEVASESGLLEVSIDGETVTLQSPVEVTIKQKALRALAPSKQI